MPIAPLDDATLLRELEPVAESLYERHDAASKEWFPHEVVPWSRGRDFVAGEAWEVPADGPPAAVRSALFVNLLTEDNLPYYFRTIERMFGNDGVWGAWARRWTAEEGRHSIVIRDYLTVTRAIDPVALERARMAQVSGGMTPEPTTAADGFAYVALQELATRISHRNTGKLMDSAGHDVMARVAKDENHHFLFYRDLMKAALEVDPSGGVIAIERQVREFEMPGTGIPDFADHARAIADAGIYDFTAHHDQILVPTVLRQWGVEELTDLTPEAEEARRKVVKRIGQVGRAAARIASRRAERDAKELVLSG
jgi:acyl-[acyl-carrier-protein] desaturase